MRESRTSGSVRGTAREGGSYRDRCAFGAIQGSKFKVQRPASSFNFEH
jgi:hypothetical protein